MIHTLPTPLHYLATKSLSLANTTMPFTFFFIFLQPLQLKPLGLTYPTEYLTSYSCWVDSCICIAWCQWWNLTFCWDPFETWSEDHKDPAFANCASVNAELSKVTWWPNSVLNQSNMVPSNGLNINEVALRLVTLDKGKEVYVGLISHVHCVIC